MIFSEQWLREWVNPSLSSEMLAEQLTMAGLEVDAITPVAGSFEGVVVAEIVSAEQHPMLTSCVFAPLTLVMRRYKLFVVLPTLESA